MAIDRRGRSTYVPLRLWRSRRGAILIYQHASLRIVAIAERDVLVIWGDEHRAHCSPAELNRQRVANEPTALRDSFRARHIRVRWRGSCRSRGCRFSTGLALIQGSNCYDRHAWNFELSNQTETCGETRVGLKFRTFSALWFSEFSENFLGSQFWWSPKHFQSSFQSLSHLSMAYDRPASAQ